MRIQKLVQATGIVLALGFTIFFPLPQKASGADALANAVSLNEISAKCSDADAPEGAVPQGSCCTWSQDLSTGQGNVPPYYGGQATSYADPLWKLNNANAYLVINLSPLNAIRMAMPPARWIQKTNYPKPAGALPGKYKFTITFTVPSCPDGRVRLTGSLAADNNAMAYLDGTPIPGASCAGGYCFKAPDAPISLNGAPVIAPGQHTLLIEVGNTGSAPSHFGLVVNAKLTRSCP